MSPLGDMYVFNFLSKTEKLTTIERQALDDFIDFLWVNLDDDLSIKKEGDDINVSLKKGSLVGHDWGYINIKIGNLSLSEEEVKRKYFS